MFPGGMPPKERFARQDILLTAFPSSEAFKALDNEFYEYFDDLEGLTEHYNDTH